MQLSCNMCRFLADDYNEDMRRILFLVFLTFFGGVNRYTLIAQNNQINWIHSTGLEFMRSSYLSVLDLSFSAAEGSVSSFNSSSEWSLNYRNLFDYHSILGLISFNALGGRFQYNSVPSFVFGVQGALDNNRFIEMEYNWFDRFEIEEPFIRKSGRFGTAIDYGVKTYGDLFFKPLEGFTWGFWNSMVLVENETKSLSLIEEDSQPLLLSALTWQPPQLYLQSTPRVLYELKGEHNRLVVELYLDSRFYIMGSVDIEGTDYISFFKLVLVPQWIVNWKGKHLTIKSYSAASVEWMQYIPYPQLVFKTSPTFTWEYLPFRFGISGGGYEFRDEIGIIFDNNELVGLKQSGSSFAFTFSPKGFISVDITSFLTVGTEAAYRGGLSIIDSELFYLEEIVLAAFFQSEISISEKWKTSLFLALDHIFSSSVLSASEPLPGETNIRFSIKLKR